MHIRIKENSWLARIAASRLRSKQVAMVLGSTIHLHNTTREEFLQNKRWLRHELAHVRQYAQHGFLRFLFLYLLESVRKGYRNNRFEVEARMKEGEDTVPDDLFIA
jgi:hypothetical protein